MAEDKEYTVYYVTKGMAECIDPDFVAWLDGKGGGLTDYAMQQWANAISWLIETPDGIYGCLDEVKKQLGYDYDEED